MSSDPKDLQTLTEDAPAKTKSWSTISNVHVIPKDNLSIGDIASSGTQDARDALDSVRALQGFAPASEEGTLEWSTISDVHITKGL